jgi:hypothetical protein
VLASGLVVISLGASLLAAASAGAAPTWLAPAKLSTLGQNAEQPQISVDPQGDALAVWERFNVIEVSSRPAGSASWQAPVTLSNTKDMASAAQVALDSQGDSVAVWESFDGSEYAIEGAARSGLNGSWQAPVVLKLLGTMPSAGPDLAIDPRGDAIAIWPREEKTVEVAGRPAGGVFQKPETLSSSAQAQHRAEVGIDAAGDVTAVWEEDIGGEIFTEASSKPFGGKWQTAVSLSAAGGNANEPRVAVDSQGDAVAVWERFEGEEIIEAASKPRSGPVWNKAVALTKPELGKGEPAGQQVAIDGQGDAVAVWSRTNGLHDFVEAAEGRTSSSVWQSPITLSGPGANVEEAPQVGVNERGDAVVVWERSNGASEIVEAASGSAASGSWQAPLALSAAGQNASEQQVALDEQGNAVAAWKRFDGTSYIAEAAGFDASGPLLNSLTIPTTGTVGQSLAFSTSPFDVWSALGATSWSFGDGTGQTGTSVTHAYGAPGTYTVTVTSVDVLGNVTSASARVAIAGPVTKILPLIFVRPTITGARLSPSRFRVAKRATAVSARAKAKRKIEQGTSFNFTLNEAAKLRIAFTRPAVGLRSGKRCVAPSAKLRHAHAKSCKRTLTVGTLSRGNQRAGANSVAFSGRIGSKALISGVYKATLTASADGLSSAPVTLSLTVVR